jgi:hypothetical protein
MRRSRPTSGPGVRFVYAQPPHPRMVGCRRSGPNPGHGASRRATFRRMRAPGELSLRSALFHPGMGPARLGWTLSLGSGRRSSDWFGRGEALGTVTPVSYPDLATTALVGGRRGCGDARRPVAGTSPTAKLQRRGDWSMRCGVHGHAELGESGLPRAASMARSVARPRGCARPRSA